MIFRLTKQGPAIDWKYSSCYIADSDFEHGLEGSLNFYRKVKDIMARFLLSNPAFVNTGDQVKIWIYVLLLVVAAVAIGIAIFFNTKKKQ